MINWPQNNTEAKKQLRECGIKLPTWNRLRTFKTFVFVVVITITFIAYFPKFKEVAGLIFTAIALIVALDQWLELRNETTIDNYYNRLDKANDIAIAYSKELNALRDDIFDGDIIFSSFVYMHLDTLEYSLEKYHLGYSSHWQLWRAIDTFKAQLRNLHFRKKAIALSNIGSYTPETVKLINLLVNSLEKQQNMA